MTLISLLAVVLMLAVATTAVVAVLRGRRLPGRLDRVPDRPDEIPDRLEQTPDARGRLDRLRERAAAIRGRRIARRPRLGGTMDTGWVSRPDLQPAQALGLPETRTLVDTRPLGLAVTARAADPVGYPPQDVYYVQPNIIALARGLSAAGASQRFAALALSAVMTSPLGRAQDAEESLRRAAVSANQLVRAAARREPGHSDMATTLDVVFAAADGGGTTLYFAHVGNSALWLQRAGSTSVELLTESHTVDGGPPLRAIGLSGSVAPDLGRRPVDPGDRVLLTTASRYFAVTPRLMNAVAAAHADSSLQYWIAALAEAVRSSAAPEGVTIVAAEVGRVTSFVT